jgi:hypothetical protein
MKLATPSVTPQQDRRATLACGDGVKRSELALDGYGEPLAACVEHRPERGAFTVEDCGRVEYPITRPSAQAKNRPGATGWSLVTVAPGGTGTPTRSRRQSQAARARHLGLSTR